MVKAKKILYIKLIILILVVIASLGLEYLYRVPLFAKSLLIQKKLYDKTPNSLITILKIFSNCGTQGLLIPLIFIVFLLFPLNQSYIVTSIVMYSIYFDNILKLLNGNPRPFWINPTIFRACDGGFGNPSGHAFSSFSVFLSFWHLITDFNYFKRSITGRILNFFLLFVFFGFSLAIAISRIYLSVHSINQILLGSILGISLYFFFLNILNIHKYQGNEFFNYISTIRNIILHSIKYVLMLIVLIMLFFFKKNDEGNYDELLNIKCPHLKEYRKFNKDGLFLGLVIVFQMGSYYGLLFLIRITKIKYPNKEKEINNWERGTLIKLLKKVTLLFPFLLPEGLYVIVPDKSRLIVIFAFKVIFPYFLTGFFIYGCYIYSVINCKLANENLYLIKIGNEVDSSEQKAVENIEIEISIKHNDQENQNIV